jgi:peptidoglycan/LPS O-acetylase OafA/YrhL
MLFAIAAAWVFYVLFEKPAIRWAAGIKALRKS